MHKKYSLFLVVIFFVAGFAHATSLTIGRGYGQYPPYEWSDNNELKGIHIDLIRKTAESINVDVDFISLPWNRALIELEAGRIDALTFMGKSEKRARYTLFLDGSALSESRLVLFRRIKMAPFLFNGALESLRGKSIGVKRGFYYGEAFNSSPLFQRLEMKTYQQMMKMVYLERLDFGIVNHYELSYLFRDDPLFAEIEFVDPPVSVAESFLGFSKKANVDDKAKEFAQAMKIHYEGEFYRTLLRKYKIASE